MAHFYGTVQGGRGEASRLGHKSTGLETLAASHSGGIKTTLSVRDGVDWADVEMVPHQGAGVRVTLYSGPVGHYQTPDVSFVPGIAAGGLN